MVFGKEIDLLPHAIDRYGRTVAQVGVDGKDVARKCFDREWHGSMTITSQRHPKKLRTLIGKLKMKQRWKV